jgi:isoamylase
MPAVQDLWEREEGSASPLGAIWLDDEKAYNFAIYSKEADSVTLLLYSESEFAAPLRSIPFEFPRNKTSRIWHARVAGSKIEDARYYAYRVSGPFDPAKGQRFDSDKILLDPYATAVFFPPGHSRVAACGLGSNAGRAPLAILPPRQPVGAAAVTPGPRHTHDLIIYELHVRGFTRRDGSIAEAERGTFAAIVAKIPYLKDLGITAVELLPVHQFDPQEGNYWGYMTLNFFAPHAGYARDGTSESAIAEFRWMVDELHKAGIEVFLDVVYNHTTEMGAEGPTYCFRGIDNSSYYVLDRQDMSTYINHSACGNDMRTAHPVVRRLVVDSLGYWAREMGVDGFRFDLASIFARSDDGDLNLEDPPIISEISSDPNLADVRLIAEPWQGQLGSGYLMGRAFPGRGWRQWNDHFRDAARSLIKGDGGYVPAIMTRLYGSTDLFPDDKVDAFRPYQSVNYVDCHDGLNLCDLVSFTDEQQRSWDCGHAGLDGSPPEVTALRRRQVKNFCCLVMFSNGTPMFVAGDEFMNTQQGSANPWDQDNETTWLDWSLTETNEEILRFFRMMIAFRKSRPSIGRSTGWTTDVRWHGVGVMPDLSPYSRALAFHLRDRSADAGDIYVMINAYWQNLTFEIQAAGRWSRVVDTALVSPSDIVVSAAALPVTQNRYDVAGRSIVVLIRS